MYSDIFESPPFSFRIQKFPRPQVSDMIIRHVSGFTLIVPRTPLGILGSLRYRDYGLRLRINMLLRMIRTT